AVEHGRRQRLAVPRAQQRFLVERLERRRAAGLEQPDDAAHARREVGQRRRAGQQRAQRQRAEAAVAAAEERAASPQQRPWDGTARAAHRSTVTWSLASSVL